jgi:hypothetical protein
MIQEEKDSFADEILEDGLDAVISSIDLKYELDEEFKKLVKNYVDAAEKLKVYFGINE